MKTEKKMTETLLSYLPMWSRSILLESNRPIHLAGGFLLGHLVAGVDGITLGQSAFRALLVSGVAGVGKEFLDGRKAARQGRSFSSGWDWKDLGATALGGALGWLAWWSGIWS